MILGAAAARVGGEVVSGQLDELMADMTGCFPQVGGPGGQICACFDERSATQELINAAHLRKVSTEYEDNFNTHRPRRALNQPARCDRYPTRSKPTSKSSGETGSMASNMNSQVA
jgi:hypothetical protein